MTAICGQYFSCPFLLGAGKTFHLFTRNGIDAKRTTHDRTIERTIVLNTMQARSSTAAQGGARVMKSISVSAVVILVLVAIAAFAQKPQDLIYSTDLGPSGYI